MKKSKPYDQMNVKELGDATKDLDEEFVFEKGREMSPQQRREFDAWRKLANEEHLQRKRLGYECKRVQVGMFLKTCSFRRSGLNMPHKLAPHQVRARTPRTT